MFCKKFFSRSLLSLFAFNSLNVVAPVCAMESCEKNNKPSFESWCGDYLFNDEIGKNCVKSYRLLCKHNQLISKLCDVRLNVSISKVYKEIFNFIYNFFVNDRKFSKQKIKFFESELRKFGLSYLASTGKILYKNENNYDKFKFVYACIKKECPGGQGYLILDVTCQPKGLYAIELDFVKSINLYSVPKKDERNQLEPGLYRGKIDSKGELVTTKIEMGEHDIPVEKGLIKVNNENGNSWKQLFIKEDTNNLIP